MDSTYYEFYNEPILTTIYKKTKEELDNSDKTLHCHNCHEIYFLVNGTRKYMLNNEIIDVSKYDCIIVKQGTLHRTFGGNGFERLLIFFKDSYLTPYATKPVIEYINKIFTKKIIHLDANQFFDIQSLFKKISSETGIKQYIYFINIISILIENINKEVSMKKNNYLITDIIEYIEVNYKDIVTLEEITGEFFIAKEYLCRLFKKTMGVSVMTYLNIIKIKHANELLTNTDMSITEISFECGFNSSTYFGRTFKKIIGVTPGEYRKQSLNS